MHLSGIKRFVTQKLSWNNINRFPYQTFHWVGIDGSTVLTHFPPGDTYTNSVSMNELMTQIEKYRERALNKHSLLLFGNGDGGGGPQAEMIERIERYYIFIRTLNITTFTSTYLVPYT